MARTGKEVQLEIAGAVTPAAILDELEARYPMLKGTIRDHQTKSGVPSSVSLRVNRISTRARWTPVPDEVLAGKEPFLIVGAMAGG
ncbi:MAG: hypothetical protein R2867_41520 [Caldilineaceae bacterium]